MDTVHPNIPAHVAESVLAQVAEIEQTLAEIGPRQAIAERVAAARAAVDARKAEIVARHGVVAHADRATGAVHHHPALRTQRTALHRAQAEIRRYDELQRKADNLRKVLAEGRDRPEFKCYSAPPIRGDQPGTRLVWGPDGKPYVERVESDAPRVCEFDGEAGKRSRRARHN
jgi:hypothetical protein